MAENNVLAQIRKLDEQKAKLMNEAKAQAVAKAEQAVAELNELGFNYRLVEGGRTTARAAPSGTRRTGIRDDVLRTVKEAGQEGIAPATIREKLQLTDKAGSQSVANALSALKRASKIGDKNGLYTAA